ncbi:glycosyltransferase family 2 protein [Rhodococcus sp. NPDC127528]|uniref:glycosyltransferase family 2 protein n=1 Tax=unclassified Rhodococcus (in: high G+C Gram-positive bacteria) TaxID=192944 RepID=UPI00363A8954
MADVRTQRLRPVESSREPSVSVVVPCYKYGKFLPDAVGSALSQTGVRVDVRVVDDASPDDSAEVARALAAADSRVSCVVHSQNHGHIATYNEGLGRATGDYVVLLSADDLLTPGSLRRATDLLEARRDLAFVYGYAPSFSDRIPVPNTQLRSWSVWSGTEWLGRICSRGNGLVTNPEAVMRRSVLAELGGYDAAHPHAADFKLWLHASLRGAVGRVNGPDQAFYRVHGANMHLTDFNGVFTDLRERRRAFEDFFAEERTAYPEIDRLRPVALRALAHESLKWGSRAYDESASKQREMGARTALEEYTEFAVDTWPDIRGSASWRACERRSRGEVSWIAQQMSAAEWSLRHKLRWRRWRRFGT